MSKHARHQPGFYTSLFNDVCDRGLGSKYRHVEKAGLIGDSMSSEESSRSTRDILCTEDIFNSERSYNAKNGVLGSCAEGL